jgi:sulfite exporter TauE/SafE
MVENESVLTLIADAITKAGYVTKIQWMKKNINIWKYIQVIQLFAVAAIFLGLRYLLKTIMGYDILNVIPEINDSITLGALFITGIMTSLHCVGMCGAINILASGSKRHAVVYNCGRVLCYTLTGAAAGAMGSVFSFDKTVLNVLTVLAACAMLAMGLGMTGLFTFHLPYNSIHATKSRNSFVIGFLNGFMPCGPLAAMQLYAVSTANPMTGGLSMLSFGLGTVPLMLGFGFIRNAFEKRRSIIQQTLAVVVIILALSMVSRGLSALGINFNTSHNDIDQYHVAEINENSGEQVVTVQLGYSSYGDIAVKAEIPVKFIIDASEEYITGCNVEVVSGDFDFDVKLKAGENVIYFTPHKMGTYTYTCWMNMIKNTIYVYE